ncbi:hypothetical protein LEL_08893 [Akanthomyces lecanii RCEF 1005]|uniref:Uncharacterized protein n=1 Tax=Akanthomyces lecanii RCEF 1005 TaxID=1081108 RepID=A0A168CQ86_CORDF|nr:hypothetical protein LEL_08893 [Akanthomyces lecanii RCEF 1005]
MADTAVYKLGLGALPPSDSCGTRRTLYGEFLHDGPKGSNLCIAADFLGFSLRQAITDYYDDGNHLESGDILRLGGQLIEALKPLRSFTRLASLPIESPPEVKLKHSVRCPTIKYCGRAPKGLQQGIATPFTRLDKGTWLLNRPQKDVYALLIDAYRLRVVDLYNLEGDAENDSLYGGASSGRGGFQRFLASVAALPGLLPPW